MALCIAAFPFMSGNASTIQKSVSDKCCHKMVKGSPCAHSSKKQCDPVACQSMIGGASIAFLKTEIVTSAVLIPTPIEKALVPDYIGELSQYSSISFRPPAV